MNYVRSIAVAGLLITMGAVLPGRQDGIVVTGDEIAVPGASVRFQGALNSILTDQHGRFEPLPNARHTKLITACKAGYGIASAPAERIPLRLRLFSLPAHDNEDYAWVDPAPNPAEPHSCGNCHAEIYREWSLSGHARAVTNPRTLDVFQKLATDRPDDIGVCARCHAPTFRDPALDYDLRVARGVDRHGVHCDFCHKIVEAPTGKLGTRFGADGYQLLRPSDGQQLFFGPLDDAVRPGEMFGYSPLYQQSSYCASCHEGIIYGVHVYSTYSEWLASPARQEGKHCQTCHMAPSGKLTNIAPGHGGIERDARSLASHTTPGGTPEMLRRCLSIKASLKQNVVMVEVLASQVGHRVPTGFIDRNLFLRVDAQDKDGKPLQQVAGPVLPEAVFDLAGTPGKLFAKLLTNGQSTKPIPFWRPDHESSDTRLWPGQADHVRFEFDGPIEVVRVALYYQRLWGRDERITISELSVRRQK
jgi:hypothetical protein